MTSGWRVSGSSRDGELLSLLYRRVTEQQAARFGAGYDLTAAEDRFRAWLRDHTAGDQARLEAAQPTRPVTAAAVAVGWGEAQIAIEDQRGTEAIQSDVPAVLAAGDTDRAVTALYQAHYRSLVRLAVLLIQDLAMAEEIVQDSFVALHQAWRKQGTDWALSYLRQSMLHRSRSALRRRMAAERNVSGPAWGRLSAGQPVKAALERPAVISALHTLPARQREALVLRYYAGLPETQIASIMGISKDEVRKHTARARASLRAVLDNTNY